MQGGYELNYDNDKDSGILRVAKNGMVVKRIQRDEMRK